MIAGLGDLNRPVEKLSIPQSASLAATGLIWSRYSLVIIPKNYSLFAVNVFVAITSLYQIGRAYKHKMSQTSTKWNWRHFCLLYIIKKAVYNFMHNFYSYLVLMGVWYTTSTGIHEMCSMKKRKKHNQCQKRR